MFSSFSIASGGYMAMMVKPTPKQEPPELGFKRNPISDVISSSGKPLVETPIQPRAEVIFLDEERAKALAEYNRKTKDDKIQYEEWLKAYASFPDRPDLYRVFKRNKYNKAGTEVVGKTRVLVNKVQACWLLEGDHFGDPDRTRHRKEGGYPTREYYERASDNSTYSRRVNGLKAVTNILPDRWVQQKVTAGFEHLRRPPTLVQILEKHYSERAKGLLSNPTPMDYDIEFFTSEDENSESVFDSISFDTYDSNYEELVKLGLAHVSPEVFEDVKSQPTQVLPFQDSAAVISTGSSREVSLADEVAAIRRLGCGRRGLYELGKTFQSRSIHVGHDAKTKWGHFYSAYRERMSKPVDICVTGLSPINDDCMPDKDKLVLLKVQDTTKHNDYDIIAEAMTNGHTNDWVFSGSSESYYQMWLYERQSENEKALRIRARDKYFESLDEINRRIFLESLPNVLVRQHDFVNQQWYTDLSDEDRYYAYWKNLSFDKFDTGYFGWLTEKTIGTILRKTLSRVEEDLINPPRKTSGVLLSLKQDSFIMRNGILVPACGSVPLERGVDDSILLTSGRSLPKKQVSNLLDKANKWLHT